MTWSQARTNEEHKRMSKTLDMFDTALKVALEVENARDVLMSIVINEEEKNAVPSRGKIT